MFAGLVTAARDTRYSQLRSAAYSASDAIAKSKIILAQEPRESLLNTIKERLKSEMNSALQSHVQIVLKGLQDCV